MDIKKNQTVNNSTNSTAFEPSTIGERIKALRKKKGYTQERLGSEVHSDKTVVSRWEKGEKIPNSDAVTALAQLFGVTTFFLLYGRSIDTADNLLDLNGLTYYQIDLVKKLVEELRSGC